MPAKQIMRVFVNYADRLGISVHHYTARTVGRSERPKLLKAIAIAGLPELVAFCDHPEMNEWTGALESRAQAQQSTSSGALVEGCGSMVERN